MGMLGTTVRSSVQQKVARLWVGALALRCTASARLGQTQMAAASSDSNIIFFSRRDQI